MVEPSLYILHWSFTNDLISSSKEWENSFYSAIQDIGQDFQITEIEFSQ